MLRSNKEPISWLVKDKEGHGFYNKHNLLTSNQINVPFGAKYIGS